MKVFQNGKEVKDAKVSYINGVPFTVRLKGDHRDYDAAAFEFKDSAPAKKTRTGAKADKNVMTSRTSRLVRRIKK